MNGYFFTASVTRFRFTWSSLGPAATGCQSLIVCADKRGGGAKTI